MKILSRRTLVKSLGLAAAACSPLSRAGSLFSANADPDTQLARADLSAIEEIVRRFLGKFEVPGISLAFAREGKLVLRRGFGVADKKSGAPVRPENLFRIASVSKPITSVAIFSLIEQGRLGLDDLVFGEKGRLRTDLGKEGSGRRGRSPCIISSLTHAAAGRTKRTIPCFFSRRCITTI